MENAGKRRWFSYAETINHNVNNSVILNYCGGIYIIQPTLIYSFSDVFFDVAQSSSFLDIWREKNKAAEVVVVFLLQVLVTEKIEETG